MPKKAPAAAPPSPTENLGSEESMAEVAYNESVAEDPPPPARKGGKRSPVETEAQEARAAERIAEAMPEDNTDWTKPEYADDPGDFEFGSLDDESSQFYSILWWGREGTGKSTDLALITEAVPGEAPVLIINAEGGLKRRPLEFHGVDVSRIRTYPQPGKPLTFEGLERLFYRLLADFEKDPNAWAAVGWDSVTEIVQTMLDNVVEDDMRNQAEILKKAGRGRGGRSGNVKMRDRFEQDRDDYRKMSNQVRLLLRKYKTLPCHLLITALERRDEDERTKKVVYGPSVTPALQTDILGYVDVVLHTKTEEIKGDPVYYAVTTAASDARGKDRLGGLPYELVDPAANRVFAYLSGELDEDHDPVQKLLPGDSTKIRRRSIAGTGSSLPVEEAPVTVGKPDEDDSPKHGGRRAPAGDTSATPSEPGESPKPARAPRKTAAQRKAEEEARAQAVQDGIANDTPPPRARKGGKRAAPAAKSTPPADNPSGFTDKPPF